MLSEDAGRDARNEGAGQHRGAQTWAFLSTAGSLLKTQVLTTHLLILVVWKQGWIQTLHLNKHSRCFRSRYSMGHTLGNTDRFRSDPGGWMSESHPEGRARGKD